MAANELPDELIKEILTPVLRVSDEQFSNTSPDNDFATLMVSSSEILLVSKRWARVATPLLYEVIVLRSKAQADRLALALRAHKEFGLYVRKLRVEGAFVPPLEKIILATPNIDDLFLSLEIYASDNVTPLTNALPSINPTRLIIHDGNKDLSNLQVDNLVAEICRCFVKWTRLTLLDIASDEAHEALSNCVIISNLFRLSNLKTLHLRGSRAALEFLPSLYDLDLSSVQVRVEEYEDRISRYSNLINHERANDLRDLKRYLERHPKMKEIVSIVAEEGTALEAMLVDEPVLSPNALATDALSNATVQEQEAVFDRIIFFAMQLDKYSYVVNDSDLVRISPGSRSKIALVSKTFHRLSLPYLYGYPIVIPFKLTPFCKTIIANPALGAHLRCIFIQCDHPHTLTKKGITARRPGAKTDNSLHKVLALAPNLVQLCAIVDDTIDPWSEYRKNAMAWAGFEALARVAGSTLEKFEGMHIDAPASWQSPTLFGEFKRLRSLRWDTITTFDPVDQPEGAENNDHEDDDDEEVYDVQPEYLQTLEFLTVGMHDESFFEVLAAMELPNIHTLTLTGGSHGLETFLRKHGGKIHHLDVSDGFSNYVPIFDLCPSLDTLTFTQITNPPDLEFFQLSHPYAALTKMIIVKRGPAEHQYGRARSKASIAWNTFLEKVDLGSFPSLRELQMPTYCVWPYSEHDVKKSLWPARAERLATEWDIAITDVDGRRWKPRLQSQNTVKHK